MHVQWINEEPNMFLGFGLGQLSVDEVRELQGQMNRDLRVLRADGVPNVPNDLIEDGIAGDGTCNAGTFINNVSPKSTPYPVGVLCQMAADRKRPPAPPPTPPETPPTPPVTTAPAKKKSNWGLALLGAAAVVAGVYALA